MEIVVFSGVTAYFICGFLACAYHLTKINEAMAGYERTRLKDRKNEFIMTAQYHWDSLKGSWLWPLSATASTYRSVKWVLSLGGA
jgi:hypothetical protein